MLITTKVTPTLRGWWSPKRTFKPSVLKDLSFDRSKSIRPWVYWLLVSHQLQTEKLVVTNNGTRWQPNDSCGVSRSQLEPRCGLRFLCCFGALGYLSTDWPSLTSLLVFASYIDVCFGPGFKFLHPLQPTFPSSAGLNLPSETLSLINTWLVVDVWVSIGDVFSFWTYLSSCWGQLHIDSLLENQRMALSHRTPARAYWRSSRFDKTNLMIEGTVLFLTVSRFH